MAELKTESPERQPRYSVCDSRAIEVHIERGEGREPTEAPAELLDLSLTGARFAVPIAIQPEEAFYLWLKHEETDLDESVASRVRWVRPGRSNSWLVGCSFVSELSASTIDSLAALGCLDHEIFDRSPIGGEATVWEQLKPSGETVRMVDLSKGGLSLLSPNAAPVGQRLRLVPHDSPGQGTDIIVQVRCCAALADGFLLSCKFEYGGDYRALRGRTRVHNARGRGRVVHALLRQSKLISRTTILLLGGMLVGLAMGLANPSYALIGLLSVVAYVGLELAEVQRNRVQQSKWSDFFEELLEQRLAEHHANLQSGWTARPLEPAPGIRAGLAVSNSAS